jgi:amidase
MPDADLRPSDLGAVALSRAIHDRSLSCVAVMEDYLARIGEQNPWSNAIVALRSRSDLLDEALACDRDLAAGRSRGWMHGFPQAIKDLAPAASLPFTQGSPIFAQRIAAEDAPFVARMRASGAIFIGKTNTPEFGLGSQTHNPVYGATRNAYDPSRTSGGSSGGAAVALALRMLPVADGSDHAGSLRNPAAWNNVFGLRPGAGRVVDDVTDVFTVRLTVAGPMARSVEDLAHLLAVQAGADPRAPLSIDEDPAALAAAFKGSPSGLRIGWLGDFGGHVATEPTLVEQSARAMSVFEDLGARVEPASPGFDMERLFQAWKTLRHIQAGRALLPIWQDETLRPSLKPEARWEVEEGLKLSGFEVAAAQAVRSEWFQAVRQLFERFDLLALPATQVFPFPVETLWPRDIAGRTMDTYHRWMEIVVPATMSGCPVMSIPAGFTNAGLPLGVQLWAPWRKERALLEAAYAYDRATRWPDRAVPTALRR